MFKPLFAQVLIRRTEAPKHTAGGLTIPESARDKNNRGTVVEIGNEVKYVQEGNIVIWDRMKETEVKVDGETLLLIPETSLMGVELISRPAKDIMRHSGMITSAIGNLSDPSKARRAE